MRERARRWAVALALGAGALALASELVVPALVIHEVRDALEACGFANARFELASANLARVELAHVTLDRGLELGDVELDAGVWQLARGGRTNVVLRGPRIDVARLLAAAPRVRSRGKQPVVRQIRVHDGELAFAGARIAVAGTIDLAPLAFDLTATTARLQLGPFAMRDVVAKVRGRDGTARACVAGSLEGLGDGATAEACATTPSLDPRHVGDALAITWAARAGERWSAYGRGDLVRDAGGFALRDGRVDVALRDAALGTVAVEGATLHAVVEGRPQALALHGEVRAATVAGATARAGGVALPFAAHARVDNGTLRVTSDDPLVVRATHVDADVLGRPLAVTAPSLTIRGGASLAGGRLTVATAGDAIDDTARLALELTGVELATLIPALSRGRVDGTGLLDGRLELELAASGLAVARGSLRARGGGSLRVTDAALRRRAEAAIVGPAVYERVAAALADFSYARLAIAIGRDPDVRIQLEGRGRRVPQELTVELGIRGARGVADRFVSAQPARGR